MQAAWAFRFVADAWLRADPELAAWVAEAREAHNRILTRL
jgi:hypothetical protein